MHKKLDVKRVIPSERRRPGDRRVGHRPTPKGCGKQTGVSNRRSIVIRDMSHFATPRRCRPVADTPVAGTATLLDREYADRFRDVFRVCDPLPVFESCLQRIFSNVAVGSSEILRAANQAIEVAALPDRACPAEESVYLLRGVRLPGMEYAGQVLSAVQTKENVNVIRHHAPGEQFVALAVEVAKR